jgi:NADH dehydrogenase
MLPRVGSVIVFGGTGFLGRRIVRHLLAQHRTVRIASRHPERTYEVFAGGMVNVEPTHADVRDEGSVAVALNGCWAAVNAVSLYVEREQQTFHSVHVEGAAKLAVKAREAGLARLLHVSGIGSNPRSNSKYIRSRGEGEVAVRKEFPGVTIIRPAVMFGADDGFLVPITKLLRRLPVFGMFGRGRTKLQPAYVDDVAKAMASILKVPKPSGTYELGGPTILTYRQLLERIRAYVGSKTILVPVPFSMWLAIGFAAELLQTPPVTCNQVELMRENNVAWDGPGFASLEIRPADIEAVLSEIAI